jgi:hypothetical protein
MLPGPDQIIACPHCQGLAKYMTLMSGNTFGASVWTDGKQIAPMLPRSPAVVRCRHCKRFYWLASAEEVGTLVRWGGDGSHVDPTWTSVEEVEEPSEEEYYAAIEGNLASDRRQERFLRIFAWWRGNDPLRERLSTGVASVTTRPNAWRRNLEALAELLNEDDENDLVMKAEVLRELGEFGAAIDVLSRVGSPEYRDVVRQIRSLCDREDSDVKQLRFET